MRRILPLLTITSLLCLSSACKTSTDNYSVADRDHDGKLSKSEVKKALMTAIYANGRSQRRWKNLLFEYATVDPDYPKARFNERDLNGDGYVTPQELDRFSEKLHGFDHLVEAFDADGDGCINRKEAAIFNAHLQKAEGDNALQNSTT
ncbi:MAG: EF-hand domain-containing protein [Verrucomicrobiales bacterium]